MNEAILIASPQAAPALTGAEAVRLRECEAVIERGRETFVKVGLALSEIRDRRLYRTEYDTFEGYCRVRWRFSRVQAHRLIEAANVVKMLPVGNTVTSERQARELARAPEGDRVEVLRQAIEAGDGKVTAELIREIVDRRVILQASAEIRAEQATERRQARLEMCAGLSGAGPFPARTFNVLLSDPPWQSDFHATDNRRIENHYPTMTEAEICALPVPTIAAADSVCLLWTPNAKLDVALRVLAAWGFEYRTNAVWIKGKWGTGFYFRQQHELLLVGRRGELPVPEPGTRVSSVIEAPRAEHSAKPRTVHEIADAYWPGLPKVELFCRGAPPPGWVAWGNEADLASEPCPAGACGS